MWRELWFKMADGVKSEYDKIKSTNLFEFYHLFDLWRDKIDRERKAYERKAHQSKADKHGK